MEKITLLTELREFVEEDLLLEDRYVGDKGGFICHCAIGHLMRMTGVDMTRVKVEANDEPISNVKRFHPELLETLYEAGFTDHELARLQLLNDFKRWDGTEPILMWIDEMIEGVPA